MEAEKKKTSPISDLLLEWKEVARPFKKRDSSFFQTIAALAFLIIVILFFIREWLIIGTALAVVFVAYALAAVPPPIIKYQITEKGVWIDDIFYRFSELSEYWFEKNLENIVLIILAPTRRIGRLMLVIPAGLKEKVNETLQKRLVFREKPLKTFVESAADWLRHKVPLEESKA